MARRKKKAKSSSERESLSKALQRRGDILLEIRTIRKARIPRTL